jgi:hypothetical protein
MASLQAADSDKSQADETALMTAYFEVGLKAQ